MHCRKCKKEIPEESKFCLFCGASQAAPKKKAKQRGNGQGSVYKLPSGSYRLEITLGYTLDGKRVARTKSGFKTKKEALEYLPVLRDALPAANQKITWLELYDQWKEIHSRKTGESIMNMYRSAMNHFKPIYFMRIQDIKTLHIQRCVDECKAESFKNKMKILAGLLFKYAIQQDMLNKNYAKFVQAPPKQAEERQVFTKEQIEIIASHAGKTPGADAILILIYTGFRLNEFLSLKKSDFDANKNTLTGGSKTQAGKNRVIPLSTKIQNLVKDLSKTNPESPYLYPNTKGQKYDPRNFREYRYYPALKSMNLPLLIPHSCRHTFATLIKGIDAPAEDKQKLMGHASFEMTAHYTHTNEDDLREIIKKI